MFHHLEFRELQKKSEFERAEWVRKQGKRLQLESICIHLPHLHMRYNVTILLFLHHLQVLTLSSTWASLLLQSVMCC